LHNNLPRNFEYKLSVNELNFPLVTHMIDSDVRFDSYGVLKSGQGAENFWTDWTYRWMIRLKGRRCVNLDKGRKRIP
jgi:hypothetical protein